MENIRTFSINETRRELKGPWDPKDLIDFSNFTIRVATFEGTYGETKHTHPYDEFFLVLEGEIVINTDQGEIRLVKLEGAIVPKGMTHQPFAEKTALVLMLDPKEN